MLILEGFFEHFLNTATTTVTNKSDSFARLLVLLFFTKQWNIVQFFNRLFCHPEKHSHTCLFILTRSSRFSVEIQYITSYLVKLWLKSATPNSRNYSVMSETKSTRLGVDFIKITTPWSDQKSTRRIWNSLFQTSRGNKDKASYPRKTLDRPASNYFKLNTGKILIVTRSRFLLGRGPGAP